MSAFGALGLRCPGLQLILDELIAECIGDARRLRRLLRGDRNVDVVGEACPLRRWSPSSPATMTSCSIAAGVRSAGFGGKIIRLTVLRKASSPVGAFSLWLNSGSSIETQPLDHLVRQLRALQYVGAGIDGVGVDQRRRRLHLVRRRREILADRAQRSAPSWSRCTSPAGSDRR